MNATLDATACPDRDTWAGLHAGTVPADRLPHLADHLDHCPPCRAVLDAVADTPDELVEELRAAAGADPFAAEPLCRDAVARARELFDETTAVGADAAGEPVPERLGEYRVLGLIGRGGMGAVYRAVHARLGREVVLKVLPPDRAADAAAVARFHREVAAIGRLDHPNVVRATDAGEAAGRVYLVMDLVRGADAGRLVRAGGPLPVADACEVARQAAAGLQHLAGHAIVHRDVKPSNLMVGPRGEVKVLDLGLALADPDGASAGGRGALVGTYDYLAPEQAGPDRRVDARADVYALGCTLYHLLAGRPPFAGPAHATVRDKLLAHAAAPVPEVQEARPEVPAGLSAVLRRMLAKDPADRYASPADAGEALVPSCAGSDLPALLDAACPGVWDFVPPLAPGDTPLPQTISLTAVRRPPRRRVAALALVAVAISAAVAGVVVSGPGRPATADGPPARVEGPSLVAADVPEPGDAHEPAAAPQPDPVPAADRKPAVYPVALLGFEERGAGARDLGPKVSDLLFARLAAKPGVVLVDRGDLKKVLDEQAIGRSGAVKPDEAAGVGRLTGAKLLVTGSVVHVDRRLTLVAKLIGTETGLVAGASVDGAADDELGPLVERLADRLAEKLAADAERLSPRPPAPVDRVAALGKRLGKAVRPALCVTVTERHVGTPTIDPAAETEVMRFAGGTGFELFDAKAGGRGKADVVVTGEGFSELAGRHGGLVAVRARVELKAVERRTGRVLAADRQTALVVDVSEQVAGKQALQDAAAVLAERVLPRLVTEAKK